MKKYKEWTYTDKIRWRIRALWALLACMLVYMVLVGVLGGGDSRVMTPLARLVSRVISGEDYENKGKRIAGGSVYDTAAAG